MMSARDRNRIKAQAYQATAGSLAGELIGQKDIIRNMRKMPGDVQAKITQNAIKPIVKLSTATWKREIKGAKVSGNSNAFRRRYGGTSLRVALAKSVKSRNPSGKGKKSLRGYSMSAGGVTKHGAKGEATTNAGQIWWLEYGTKPHSLGNGRRHPGTKPVTHIRKAVERLKPRARRMFETAVRLGIRSGGERITAQQFKRMTK